MNNDTPPVSFGEILVGEMVGDVVDYLCHLIDAQVAVMARSISLAISLPAYIQASRNPANVL